VQARVFEPFFTTKDIHKGSGLGLPQVYGFAQQCLGRVTIQSAVGIGTTVTLLLPRSRQASVAAAGGNVDRVADGGAHNDRRKHVLLVEDDRHRAADEPHAPRRRELRCHVIDHPEGSRQLDIMMRPPAHDACFNAPFGESRF